MNLYAESSAILAWLFSEDTEPHISEALESAEAVASSDLTLVECDRAIWRVVALGELSEVDAGELHARLTEISSHWTIMRLSPEVIQRARQKFPSDPIRALDALHVASALIAGNAIADLAMLSLDERVRRVAVSLGLPVLPS